MKKPNILSFLLGIIVIFFVAAQSPIQIFQPKIPVATEVKSFRAMYGLEMEIKSYIEQKIRQGFIVKSVAIMDDENWSKGIVVMEKY